jgi:hypothetical protein
MVLTEKDNLRNKKYVEEFYQPDFKLATIPRVEIHNELILIEKIK